MAKILIVDDRRDNIFSATVKLKEDNYEILTETQAEEALKKAEEELPDCILLDVNMPEMDGFEICRRLKQNPKTQDIPVLFTTAIYRDTESIVRGLEVGGDDYIVSPFEAQELRARVKVLVRLKKSRDELREKNLELELANEQLREKNNDLIRANNFLSSIMDWSDYSILTGDLQGTILTFNEGGKRTFAYEAGEVIGKPIGILFTKEFNEPEQIQNMIEAIVTTGRYEGEMKGVRKNQEIFPVHAVFTLRKDENGKPFGFVNISRDLSKEKKLELTVEQKEEELQRATQELERKNKELELRYKFKKDIIGYSPKMLQVFKIIEQVSQIDSTVLIQGESGTGKELIAKAIHYNSPRAKGPLRTVNCAALPETLIESELFGHEKGAFTGADRQKKGQFELANKGTIFLDEIGEVSLSTQVKLLRVLQEKEIIRVGGDNPIKIDVRIITATNKNLEEEVKKGNFRQDLLYRLNVIPIVLPPLRERRDDIQLLVNHFLKKTCERLGKKVKISPEAMQALTNYQWPGNVRELENIIERAVVFEETDTITLSSLPQTIAENAILNPSWDKKDQGFLKKTYQELKEQAIENFHRELLDWILIKYKGNVGAAARELGLDKSNFRKIIKKYHINVRNYRQGLASTMGRTPIKKEENTS
ncbi:MAG TPA: sigma 54-interacting transcriptional regulator [Candidatus Limnocylindrales bacterium]|nr:sigma 54-interacting transcriptional regulator [Candidatus Limnocylindrales bacterium]